MKVADVAAEMVTTVRARGKVPAYLAVSPDVYSLWESQNYGVEPLEILGLPICIRDNFKPRTLLILGQRDTD